MLTFMDGQVLARTDELALLARLIGALSAGVGEVVLVEGEQGIGKSALLRTGLAGAVAAGCRVLWAAADELGQQFPLRLITECIGAAGTEVAAGGPVTGSTGVFAGDPVLAAVERVLATVDRLCAASPVVLVAEDLQWADDASLIVWSRLCLAAAQMPLLLAGSWRPGTGREELERLRRGVTARGGTVLQLRPLPESDISTLVETLVGGRPGKRLTELMGQAGGNPLYARELAESLQREGQVIVARGVAELEGAQGSVRVPSTLSAAIGERLAGLAGHIVQVLRWAAVLGTEFSVADLEVVSGRTAGNLIGVIDIALDAGVLADAGPRLGFRHGLIRQTIYEGVPAGERAFLHSSAARGLAGAGRGPDVVAVQLAAAQRAVGTYVEPWVVGWLEASAPSLIYHAPAVAARLLRAVLAQLPATDPRREDLEASLVTIAFLLNQHDEVEQVGERLMPGARSPDRVAEMAWLIGYTQLRTGRASEAVATIQGALSRCGLSDVWSARLTVLDAMVQQTSRPPDLGRSSVENAVAVAERSGDPVAVGYARHAMSITATMQRDQVVVLDNIDRALSAIGDDPRITDLRLLLLANRVSSLGEVGPRAEAIVAARQALMLAERTGTPRLGTARFALADQYFHSGQWDDAFAEIEPAVGLPGPDYLPFLVNGLIALIAGHREEWPMAEEYLSGLASWSGISMALEANCHYWLLSRALLAERSNRPGAAAEILSPALDLEASPGMNFRFELLPALARLAWQAGDAAMLASTAKAAQAEAESEPLRRKTAGADYCAGLRMGDPALVLAAAGSFKAADSVLNHGMALEDAAVLAAQRDDLAAARKALAGAVRVFTELGATWDVRHAQRRLQPFGVRPGPAAYRKRAVSGWAALTPTEVKVARLVASGQSNPDIAAELFLSRNTVQTHVSHILAKLDARSRAEIVRQALMHPASSDVAPRT